MRDRRFRSEFRHDNDGAISDMGATTCVHGNEIIVKKAGAEQGVNWDFCMKCMGPICLYCAIRMAATGECEAFEKALNKMENVRNTARQYPRLERGLALTVNGRGE